VHALLSKSFRGRAACDITRRWSGPRRQYTPFVVERRACAAAAAQRLYVRQMREETVNPSKQKLAVLLGAGFSKPWGLPLTAELMRFDEIRNHRFPGVWQEKTIAQIESLWIERTAEHQGSVDAFGRLLHGTSLFEPFVRYVALRLSSPLWHVGGDQQTK